MVSSLLSLCNALGVELWVDRGVLRYSAARDVMTPELVASIAGSRAAIVTRLRRTPERDPSPVDGQTPPEARWGDDTAPGLVVDHPDDARRRAALASLGDGPGDADESGLDSCPRWLALEAVAIDVELGGLLSTNGFKAIDPASPEAEAWLFDDSLSVRSADVRASAEWEREMASRPRPGRRRLPR